MNEIKWMTIWMNEKMNERINERMNERMNKEKKMGLSELWIWN